MNGPAGNYYDKFNAKNPIAGRLVAGLRLFISILFIEAYQSKQSVLEVGCGEGYIAGTCSGAFTGPQCIGFDVDMPLLHQARNRVSIAKIIPADAHHIPYADGSFDLVICCEVLEHVNHPEDALREIRRVSAGYLIASVPREPIWRALNLARGKYFNDLGNTPGHVNHWSSGGFARLVSRHFDIQTVRQPIPWTMILAHI
ncbi:MAG: class I SAM-dependent methyltransferase [Anaerolineae bacterium]